MADPVPEEVMMDFDQIRLKAHHLRNQHDLMDRYRIRAVMNGGPEGVRAVLGWGDDGPDETIQNLGADLPTANVMYSGLERLAQRIGRAPTLKTDMLPTKDNQTSRSRAEKRHRIVSAWDELDRLELQFPQIGRWLPGYGFTLHRIGEDTQGGEVFPVARLRDPFDVFPGYYGPNQQPTEVAIFRRVDYRTLKANFPGVSVPKDSYKAARSFGSFGGWEGGNVQGDVTIIEYINETGSWTIVEETGDTLSFKPNPLSSGPAFVVTKRASFDKIKGQYAHAFGLMAMMGKLNLLGVIGAEDSTFRETNVYGDMESEKYEKGREAINFFAPGTRVEKPTGDIVNQTWQAINILERQFRIVAGYDVQQDGTSPNSFATGQGMKELQSAADNNVREYQTAIKHSMELIDRKRLEWMDVMHPNTERKVFWFEGSKENEEKYTPSKDIAGDYRTRRVYGAMATFDETSKILAGLQLLGAGVIDTRTLQEQLDGLHNISLINERILQDQARDALLQSLGTRSAQMDPAADMALVEILDTPTQAITTLKRFFTPQEPQLSPAEAAMVQTGAPGAGPGPSLGAPDPIQTILTQLEGEGGGAQTVAVG